MGTNSPEERGSWLRVFRLKGAEELQSLIAKPTGSRTQALGQVAAECPQGSERTCECTLRPLNVTVHLLRPTPRHGLAT